MEHCLDLVQWQDFRSQLDFAVNAFADPFVENLLMLHIH